MFILFLIVFVYSVVCQRDDENDSDQVQCHANFVNVGQRIYRYACKKSEFMLKHKRVLLKMFLFEVIKGVGERNQCAYDGIDLGASESLSRYYEIIEQEQGASETVFGLAVLRGIVSMLKASGVYQDTIDLVEGTRETSTSYINRLLSRISNKMDQKLFERRMKPKN